MISLKTHLQPDPTYYFGNNIIQELGPLLKQHVFDRIYFVTNPLLLDLYGLEILTLFKDNKIAYETITIKDSENDKTFSKM